MPKNRIRILIADDHSVVRSGLRTLFERTSGLTVIGEAPDGEVAVELASKYKPDIAILDISMPKVNGLEATRLIKKKVPSTKVLILTMHEDEEYIDEMVRAEANGYVLKNADKRELIDAVRTVAAGGPFFSPGISALIVNRFIKRV